MEIAVKKKQIDLKSVNAILIDSSSALEQINALRKEKGQGEKGKAPITIDKFVASTKVLEERTDECGSLILTLRYTDKEGYTCTRHFPNFGLEVMSSSSLKLEGPAIAISVNVSVKAGKKKWQTDEVQECIEVLSSKETTCLLEYFCDKSSDSRGYRTYIDVLSGEKNHYDQMVLPISLFELSTK